MKTHATRPAPRLFAGAILLALAGTLVSLVPAGTADAADTSDWRPGMIIGDDVFFSSQTMTASQVQAFLNAKASRCTPGSGGVPCLKDYTQTTPDRPATAQCTAYAGAADESAARIVWKTAQACRINPQALLVILQKEQGLVTASGERLTESRYRSAMGYGCPDGRECAPAYAGFANQVYNAAARFQYYADHPSSFNHRAGVNNAVLFHPSGGCGTSTVRIRNQATAGLYNYTPYQPNRAALDAGYGGGDACSTYGNRNFWLYFRDWFGSTEGKRFNPIGHFDALTGAPGALRARGWAIDPDTTAPIYLWVTVDGVGRHVYAGADRPDVGRAHPGSGSSHGFSSLVAASPGRHRVCVTASNVDIGGHTSLGCRDATVPSGPPLGNFESASGGSGVIDFKGWAIDPDTAGPVYLWVTIDGVGRHVLANAGRGDVGRAYPEYGASHGFRASLPAPAGSHRVCVTAANVRAGSHTSLGCRGVTVRGGSPFGNFESAAGRSGGVEVKGWGIDPDTSGSLYMWVTVDGVGRHVYANGTRADVGAAYPGYGQDYGFRSTIPAAAGARRVCVTASNVGVGKHTPLGCRNVTVG